MKKDVITLAALAVLAIPVISGAAPVKPGPYFSAFLGVSAFQDADLTTDQYSAPISTFNDRAEFDPGVYVGGALGNDFGIFRLEGELSYKYNEMDTITDRDTGERYRGVDGDIGTFAFLANAFLDLHNDTPVTPYFGGGIGFATIYLSDTFGTDSLGIRRTLYTEDEDSVFAYQAGGGVEIALNRQASLDLGYRYFATERANFNEDWFQATSIKLESHNFAIGVRLKF